MQPIGVMVLSDDVSATRGFLAAAGFDADGRRVGSGSGRVFVLGHDAPATTRGPYDRGPVALDLYVRDIAATVAAFGAPHGPIEEIALGPLVMKQVMVFGPAGLNVVLIETDHRRESLLSRDQSAQTSEVHSTVWIVDDVDASVAMLRDSLGLEVPFDMSFPSAAVTRVMSMPDEDVVFRMAMGQRLDGAPTRIEPMGLTHPGAAWDSSLRSGLRGPVLSAVTGAAAHLNWQSALPGWQRALAAGIELWAQL